MQGNTLIKRGTIMGALHSIISLAPLKARQRERFIMDYQSAFMYAATKEFGRRDRYYKYTDDIIPGKSVNACLESQGAEVYRIMIGDAPIGGVVIHTAGETAGTLDLLFVTPCAQGCGIGSAAWEAVERHHPGVVIWETTAACFERQNLHFLVNCCGFHIVEYYNRRNPNPNASDLSPATAREEVFRFEKVFVNHNREVCE